ncbi:MAG: phosphoribosyltransferase [Campylobacteraceae bacterium]|jgi:xanthine phosphoribosyltransferase|nr:phosphoribosyltransferase [Campylobacteraceae bacterium]
MRYYGFEEFFDDVKKIAYEVKPYNFDAYLSIARGGMTFGHFLAHALDTRELYALNSIHYEGSKKLDYVKIFNIPDLSHAKSVLVLDDIADSGETLTEIKRTLGRLYPDMDIKIATLLYKKTSIVRPDFFAKETTEWIEFLWDFTI